MPIKYRKSVSISARASTRSSHVDDSRVAIAQRIINNSRSNQFLIKLIFKYSKIFIYLEETKLEMLSD